MLAIRALGRDACNIFCDIDPESAATLRAATGGLEARVVEADGVSAIAREAQLGRAEPAEVMVLIDPFDPIERSGPNAKTPIELAGWLADTGHRVVFWYGYQTDQSRGWASNEIARLAPDARVWCGDVLMPATFIYPGRPGAWGCGVVLANATDREIAVCGRLGRALERIGEGEVVEGNDPPQLVFHAFQ
jgi:hypothetical protein